MKILLFLLFLLKIIGIVLLCALLLILVILGIILLVPIKYEVRADNSNDLFVDAKINWLFKLVYVKYLINHGDKEFYYRFFWKTNKDNKKSKKKHNINKTKQNKEDRKTKIPSEDIILTREMNTKINKEQTVDDDNIIQKDIKHKEKSEKKSEKENYSDRVKKPNKQKNANIKKKKVKNKKIKNKKIKNKDKKEDSKVNNIKEIITKIKNFPNKKEIITKLLEFLKNLFKHILPDNYELKAIFGLEDPASTGYVLGIISAILPFMDRNHNVKIQGNFDEKEIKGEFYAKGKIYLGYIAFITIKLLLNKTIRTTIKALRTGQVNYDN